MLEERAGEIGRRGCDVGSAGRHRRQPVEQGDDEDGDDGKDDVALTSRH